MQIDRIHYPVYTLGPGRRLVIWTIGCSHGCQGCSNPELWKPDSEREVPVPDVLDIVGSLPEKPEGITITGGEPFDQPKELLKLVKEIKKAGVADLLVYSGYQLEGLRQNYIPEREEALSFIDVLIDGRYQKQLDDQKALRGSSNQKIHFLNPGAKSTYLPLLNAGRKVQNLHVDNRTITIGIPPSRISEG